MGERANWAHVGSDMDLFQFQLQRQTLTLIFTCTLLSKTQACAAEKECAVKTERLLENITGQNRVCRTSRNCSNQKEATQFLSQIETLDLACQESLTIKLSNHAVDSNKPQNAALFCLSWYSGRWKMNEFSPSQNSKGYTFQREVYSEPCS